MPFTLRNLKEDLEDVGARFDGSPDLEFGLATEALALEQSGLSYQRVPPGTWRGYEAGPDRLEIIVVGLQLEGRLVQASDPDLDDRGVGAGCVDERDPQRGQKPRPS